MADRTFVLPTRSLSREGDVGWHAEGPACEAHGLHVHPKSLPPVIVWRSAQGGPPDAPRKPGWEVRVTHYREDGTTASQVAFVQDDSIVEYVGSNMLVRHEASRLHRAIVSAESARR